MGWLTPNEADAQCAWLNTNGATATLAACPASTTATIDPGQYVSVNVVAGTSYTFSVCGNSTCDTQLTLFDATGGTNLGYNDDGCGLQSTITWTATFTGTVNLQLNTYNCATAAGACLNTTVDISCGATGGGGTAANDDPCSATPLTVGTNCVFSTYDNNGATQTTGVPAPGCASYNGSEVWFTATVPASGVLELDANTGGITDGGMAAYTAPSCTGPFTLIDCDDDGSANGLMPQITINSLAPGTTVYIMFWEYGGNVQGTFDLCALAGQPWTPPAGCNGNTAAGDNCGTATDICDLNGYCGNTSATYSAGNVNPFCGSIENNSWLSFTADATTVDITVDVSNCTSGSGVQFALYSTPDCATFTYATGSATTSCYSPIDGTGNNITFDNLTPGTTYWLMVDGFAGAVCDYVITANTGIVVGVDAGADVTICEGQSTTLTASGGDGSYVWDHGPNTASTTVSPTVTTDYIVTSNAGTAICPNDVEDTVRVIVNPLPVVTVSPDVTICQGGAGTTLTAGGATTYSWAPATGLSSTTGGTVTANPTTTTTYTVTGTENGCTNTATVTVTVTPPPVVTITPAAPTICYGDDVVLTASGATTYVWSPATGLSATTGATVTANPTTTTVYTVTASEPGCPDVTETVTVSVEPQITPNFSFTGNQCLSTNSISLTNTGTNGTYQWDFTGGVATQTGNPVTVTFPSATTFNVTLTTTVGVCSESVTLPVTIYGDPTVTASATDVSCNGAADGSISATSPDAGAYSWDNGDNGAGPHTVGPGTYTVTFTDLNACPATDVVTVNEPPVLAVTATATDASCFGVNDGSVSANNATGGTAPYTYSWDNGLGVGQLHNNVAAGTYTVTVTDANNCTATATVTVNEPAVLTLTATSADASCNGVCDGDVSATAAGGTAPYTYMWNGGLGAGQNHTGTVCANTYTVTVTDANGCTATANATVNEPPLLTVTASGTDVDCNGAATGSVSASGTGGTPGYTYSWDGGLGTGANVNNVAAGTYTVTITDANGCTATDSYTVNEPTALTATVATTDASCNGVCDGTATVTAAGGTAGYTYAWDAAGGLATTATSSNLCAGTPNVTVTDANGCTVTANGTVNEPTLLTVTTTSADASCNGVCDGDVGATGAGGTPPYTYAWDNGLGAGQNQTGIVCAGTYTVTITDANGCTATATATVNEPTLLSVTTTSADASCNGVCDGDVGATATGGTGPYTYTWDNGLGAGQNQTGTVCAGTYTVTVTDANGCTATASATVGEPSAIVASASATDVLCNGDATGTVSGSATGGTPGYTYSWDGGLGSGANHNNVVAGTYNVTATDANGCTSVATVTVNEPTPVAGVVTPTDASCNGVCDGSATVVASGGTPGYTYQWDAAGGLGTTATASNLCAGTPEVTITDANGCTGTANTTINEPTAITLATATTDPTCGNSDGDATVTPSGGTPGYTYSWSPSGGSGATESSLAAGGYTVTVTDAAGCTETATVTLTDAGAPSANITASSDVSCNGGNNGSATVTATGGTAPYNYAWSPSGGTGTNATGLIAGTYTVTVTDNIGCVATATVTIAEPSALSAAITASTDPTCATVCDGTAQVTATGGTPPYTYLWSTGGTTDTETGMCAGAATVTITDANGCAELVNVTLTDPPVLTAAIVGVDATCNGVCDGSADLTVGGGTPPYTYLWNNAETSEDVATLCAGTYDVTVTDANGCTATANVVIGEPTAITLTPASLNANCGAADGEVSVTAAGGTPGYTYNWEDATATQVGTTATVTGLPAGAYTVTVTDANGCTETAVATIVDNAAGTATAVVDNHVTCNGVCDGQATVTAAGGTAPYTYLWSSGGSAATETGLCAGTHSVDVTDANGCVASASVTITEPTALTAAITATTDVTCNGVCDGDALVTVTGGTLPYTYSWTSGGNTDTETGLCAGTHDVTVTDANGCFITVTATITEPVALTASIVGTDATCNGVCDGAGDLTVAGGTAPYTYAWTSGQTSEDVAGLCAGNYDVTVTDANGCTVTANVIVAEPVALTVTTTPTDANCGQADGQACATPAGGTAPYTYLWNDGQTTQCATGLPAGSYTVDITDNNGCTVQGTVTINDLGGGTATASVVSNVTIAGTCDGEATVVMAGGTPPYTYDWQDNLGASIGQTTVNATNLCAGDYCVVVTDAVGCTSTACITITEPTALTVTITGVDLLCNGICDGSTDITVTGGVPPYTYLWNTTATAEDLTGLCAGTYDVTVTDANGATGTANITLTEPTALSVTNTSVIHVSCFGACNGSVGINIAGGTPAYTYDWVDDATGMSVGTTQSVSNLCTGNYTVTVTDANGCIITSTVTVNEPGPIVLTPSSTNSNCGQADGSVAVVATGGTGVFTTYEWYDANPTLVGNTATVNNLPSGTYTVNVFDNNGCLETTTVTINDNSAGTAAAVVDNNVSCNGVCDGQATASMTGGVMPYTYLWSTGGTNPTETGLCAGTHTVDITDAVGCVSSTTVTITEPSAMAITTSGVDASCNGFSDGEVSSIPTGGTPGYTYDWVDQATGFTVGTTATVTGLAAGTYCVTATDLNGCTINDCITIGEPTAIVVTASATDASCGQSDGSVSAAATGGSGTYVSFDWTSGGNPVGTGITVNSIPAGTYDVLITDDTGCTGTATVAVSDLSGPTLTFVSQVDVSCNGESDGQAVVNATGGTGAITYLWTPTNQANDTATGLAAGTYTVTATDANGCSDNIVVTITEPTVTTVGVTAVVDASGNGVCDAEITVAGAGGTAPYTYEWFDDNTYANPLGQNTATASALCAQEYCVVVTDANGCTDSICATPTQPGQILTNLTPTDPLCIGSCDGIIDATVNGGVPPYTYQWFSGSGPNGTAIAAATSLPLTGACAGTYYLQVTDANGNVHLSEDEILVDPSAITGTISVISNYNGFDVSCPGDCDGSAEVTPTGGTPPYTYEWYNNTTGAPLGQQTSIATGLCADTYDVEVTDANGCVETFTITLTDPPALANTFTVVDASCNGVADGSIQTTVTGGAAPYTYQWGNAALSTTADITGEPAGTYTVTITDANGCQLIQTETITEPVDLTMTSSTVGSNCGQSDGSATVNIVTGAGPFTYQWDAAAANQTTPTASNLTAGCYTCVVTDANSCQDSIVVCVLDLGSPTVSILTQTDATCFGACDGFAQIQVSGGTPPYSYNWLDANGTAIGQTTASAFNLCAGTYTGEMIDANGCLATVSVTIGEPTQLNAVITAAVDVTCFGFCDGEATVLASGATAPYSYLWSDGNAQTTPTATGLCPGNYTVTVTDAQGCDSTISVTINEPAQILTSTSSVATFCGLGLGTATVNVNSGGVAPFTYLWSDGQAASTAVGLTPGMIYVTVTDADGCAVNDSVMVNDTPPGIASISGNTPVSCNGFTDGTATVSMGGTGTAPYTYNWFNGSGNPINQTTQTATNLAAGDYYCVVADANGCVSVTALTSITEPLPLTAQTVVTDATCNGFCDGEATATVGGGTFPFQYQWNDPLQQTTITATGLCAGTWTCTITDANGCVFSVDAIINEPTAITSDSTVVNANCGQPDGQACVTVQGGTPGYTYFWPSTGGTNSCEVGLFANSYVVEVTDANGCVHITSVEVSDVSGPTASIIQQTDVSCNGLCDGNATIDMVGGAGSFFTVLWDQAAGAQTTPTATQLCAGTYTAQITDDLGCSASATVVITEPDSITYFASNTDPTCFSDCDASAWLNAQGGTLPYNYSWFDVNAATNIGSTDSISGLCDGDYILTLTDANGCTEIVNYSINQPPAPTSSGSSTPVTCNGGCDGTATASGVVGIAPFSYQWDFAANNQTTATATGLCAGTYMCTVTDADGCVSTVSVTVTEPPLLTAAINTFGNVSCSGYCDGFAQVDVAGGTAPYTYSWNNNGGISQVASNICAGTYTVTVTDFNGCTAQANVTITEPTPLTLVSSTVDVDCHGACNGSASVQVSGGTGPFTFQWDDPNFTTTSFVNNLCAGTYTATVTDVNGCVITETVLISQPAALQVTASITNSNCGQNNGEICVNVFGGQFPYTYQWDDPQTQTGACAQNLFAGCYNLTIIDGNGCIKDTVFCFNDIAGPTIALNAVTDVTCNGDGDGVIDLNVTGGTLPYLTIEWVDGAGNALPAFDGMTTINNLDGDCYSVVVTDAAGCVATFQQCVQEPVLLTSSVTSSTNVTCFGGNDGSATVSHFGGTPPYTYNWTSGATTATATGLSAATYQVTVTDANGCTSQSLVTITEPTDISISITNQVNVSCNGACDGLATASATGGTAPYLYTWQPTGGAGATATNLCDGTYQVKISDANGCLDSIPVVITEPQELLLSYTSTDAYCGDPTGTGIITPTGGTPPYTYNWPVGNSPTSNSNSGLPIGTHTVIVTDDNGCFKTIDVVINDQPGPTIDSITFVAPTCFGLSNGSATVHVSGGTIAGGYNFIWDDPSAQVSQTAIALPAGTYCVTVTDDNGCTAAACVTVTEPSELLPVPDIPRTICYGDSTQVWANAQGGTLPYTIDWVGGVFPQNAVGPHTVIPLTTTDYCFTITDANGCISPAGCVTITVTPPLELDLTPDVDICDGDSITLVANGTGGNGDPYTFNWYESNYPGGTLLHTDSGGTGSSFTVNPSSATWYYVVLDDGCSLEAVDSVLVSLNDTPLLLINVPDSAGCAPFTANFTSNTDIAVSYDWDFDCDGVVDLSGNFPSPDWTYQQSGFYDVCVTAYSADGCTTTVVVPQMIEVYPVPVADFTFTPNVTTFLNPTIYFSNTSTGEDHYSWDFGDGTTLSGTDTAYTWNNTGDTFTVANPVHTYQDTGYFNVTLTVTNSFGCTDMVTYQVYIEGDYIIFAPSAFTPNGDGVNDVWFPKGIGISDNNYDLFIFNRWGELIFESHDKNFGWDGKVKGTDTDAKLDVYVYLIRTVDHQGEAHEYIGHITLVR